MFFMNLMTKNEDVTALKAEKTRTTEMKKNRKIDQIAKSMKKQKLIQWIEPKLKIYVFHITAKIIVVFPLLPQLPIFYVFLPEFYEQIKIFLTIFTLRLLKIAKICKK